MKIGGSDFDFVQATKTPITIPDSWVSGENKIGTGHGEAKLYIASKDRMNELFNVQSEDIKCFVIRQDLIDYMFAIESYYKSPSYSNRNKFSRNDLSSLWSDRLAKIKSLPEFIEFYVQKQDQIEGSRGYINSKDKIAYQLIREIALGDISYLSVMQLRDSKGESLYYWKLFADFDEMASRIQFIENYGKKKSKSEDKDSDLIALPAPHKRIGRTGQAEYRAKMLAACPMCFITQITEQSLLIASHIKPYAACNEEEKYDPDNGFILSPLYDKLFDKGFITFTEDQKVLISNWLYPRDKERIGIKEGQRFDWMSLNKARLNYLKYHQQYVFKK